MVIANNAGVEADSGDPGVSDELGAKLIIRKNSAGQPGKTNKYTNGRTDTQTDKQTSKQGVLINLSSLQQLVVTTECCRGKPP